MARLPHPGQGEGVWGTILNDYLLQAHVTDGTLKADSVGSTQLQPNAVDATTVADGALPQSKVADLTADLAAKLDDSQRGVADGVASLDSGTKVPIAQLPTGTGSTQVAVGDHTHAGAATGTVKDFTALAGEVRSANFPAIVKANGSSYPVAGYAFDAGAEEACFYAFVANSYTSGNLTINLDWYADTASSGAVMWSAQLAAITPNTDTQDIETDALAASATTTTTHLGTTGQRLHRTTITVSALDSLAADDRVTLQVARLAADAADTMTGDAILTGVVVRYS